jgi:GNAT superfamily N-acetyltransferase
VPAVRIRGRRPGDDARCLEIARDVHAFDGYPPRGPIDVAHFLSPPQQLAAWVADVDGTVMGHAALHDTGARVTMACAARRVGCDPAHLAVVARVLVHPEARRTGVARALVNTAVEDARRRGRRPVLDVATHFAAAVALYESAGWERAGEVTITVDGEPDLPCYVYVGPDVPTT